MNASALLFWLIALWTTALGFLVLLARDVLHAAVALAGCLLGVAGLYFFLGADFVGAAQILVYVGGIAVLIIFAVMFSQAGVFFDAQGRQHRRAERAWTGRPLGLLAALGAFLFAVRLMSLATLPEMPPRPADVAAATTPAPAPPVPPAAPKSQASNLKPPPEHGTTAALGRALLGEYLLPFEIVAVLLLAVLIGAVLLVRKEIRVDPELQHAPDRLETDDGASRRRRPEEEAT